MVRAGSRRSPSGLPERSSGCPSTSKLLDRIEGLSQETKEQVTASSADIAAMRVELQTVSNFIATQEEQPDLELEQDSEQGRLSERIDTARDLTKKGQIAAARMQLEEIEREAEQLPDNSQIPPPDKSGSLRIGRR